MELKTVEEFVIEKKHLAAVAFGGLLLAGAVIFYVNSAVTAPPLVSKAQPAASVNMPAVRPVPEKREAGTLRDPFAAPAEYRQTPAADGQEKLAAVNGRKPALQTTKAVSVLPVLQGIASSGDQRRVVLQLGAESRSYGLLEQAGAYEVVEIEKDSVTLSGPGGRVVLAMER